MNDELIRWIGENPTAYQVTASIKDELKKQGAVWLSEAEEWKLERGKAYVVDRNGSALLAFFIPRGKADHFQIAAVHSDSPAFRIKESPQISVPPYVKLNVEGYGGMIDSTWFDRPLSIAGRLMVEQGGEMIPVNFDAGRDLCLIPNLAIHMNREINKGYSYNHQVDLLPLFGMEQEQTGPELYSVLCEDLLIAPEQIVAADLYLYNRQPGCVWGAEGEFVSAPRLDDLQCVFAGSKAFAAAVKENASEESGAVSVFGVFDNEEVGSRTKQGAGSTFLSDTVERICENLGCSFGESRQMIARSFLISVDNAHALHPNHPEKADLTNRPVLNGGIVIKYSADQRYTTDGASAAVVKQLCRKAGVPVQVYHNRSDIAGGSTLGNISISHVSLHSADIGLAQLAMHSAYETAGARDTAYLSAMLKLYYSTDIRIRDSRFRV